MNIIQLRLTPQAGVDAVGRITLYKTVGGHIPDLCCRVGQRSNLQVFRAGNQATAGIVKILLIIQVQLLCYLAVGRNGGGGSCAFVAADADLVIGLTAGAQ